MQIADLKVDQRGLREPDVMAATTAGVEADCNDPIPNKAGVLQRLEVG